jgi:hypothetical protein
MVRSTVAALNASRRWEGIVAALKDKWGAGTAEYRTAKRDDIHAKDALSTYQWHAAHASFCTSVIGMLINEEVRSVLHPAVNRPSP